MYNRVSFIIWLIATFFIVFFSITEEVKAEERLIKMVVLSRHGFRPPIETHEFLEEWSEKQWPYWPVKDGYLTQRGSVLVSILWEGLRDDPWMKDLFPRNICPDPQSIYVRSNTIERTQATAIAILNGFAPGCDLKYRVLDTTEWDPLFTPLESGCCSLDFTKAIQEFNQQYGGVQTLRKDLEEPLKVVADVLGYCPEVTCKKYGLSSKCSVLDIPDTITLNKYNEVHLAGGLGISALSSALFFLELGEWPKGNLSGINVSQDIVKKVFPLQTKIFNATHRIPEMATVKASGILKAITDALTSSDTDSDVNKAKLVIFVGHDANIACISGMLSVDWDIPGYPSGATPPGGMLAFTLWETPNGNVVKAHYICQSLETLITPSIYPQKIYKQQLYSVSSTTSKKVNKESFEYSEKQFKEWVYRLVKKDCIIKETRPLISKRTLY